MAIAAVSASVGDQASARVQPQPGICGNEQ